MAIIANDHTSGSGIDLAAGYAVITNMMVNKILNETENNNPDTGAIDVVSPHYAISYSAEIYKDKSSRESGLSSVETIGNTPGDLFFTTEDLSVDIFSQCYSHLAELLSTDNTEV